MKERSGSRHVEPIGTGKVLENWVKTLPNECVFGCFYIFVEHATRLTSANHHVVLELVDRDAYTRSYHHVQFVYCKFQTGDVFLTGAATSARAALRVCLKQEVMIYRGVAPQRHRL